MKLIVGLGNIGKEYENTRHNIGFMVLDSFLSDFTCEKKFQAYLKKMKIEGTDVLFVKPTTLMNLSGQSVQKIVNYFDIDIKDILIIHDDLDLPFGKFKLKENSSSGGHNGIKSIIQCLGTNEFCRLKIGISNNKNYDTKDYVLGKFSKEEMSYLKENFTIYENIIKSFIVKGMASTMNSFNSKE